MRQTCGGLFVLSQISTQARANWALRLCHMWCFPAGADAIVRRETAAASHTHQDNSLVDEIVAVYVHVRSDHILCLQWRQPGGRRGWAHRSEEDEGGAAIRKCVISVSASNHCGAHRCRARTVRCRFTICFPILLMEGMVFTSSARICVDAHVFRQNSAARSKWWE